MNIMEDLIDAPLGTGYCKNCGGEIPDFDVFLDICSNCQQRLMDEDFDRADDDDEAEW